MVQLAHPVHTASFACNVTESLPPRVVRVCLPSHPAGKFLSNHGSIASILRRPSPPVWSVSKGFTMKKRPLQQLLKVALLTSATLVAVSTGASLQERNDVRQEGRFDRQDRDDDRDDDDQGGRRLDRVRLATG